MRRFLAAVLFAAVAPWGACAAADGTGAGPVVLTVQARAAGDALHLRGRATVPDGALIVFAARRVQPPNRRAMGYAEVTGHGYAGTLDIAGWPQGDIVVDAHFQMLLPDRSQPAALEALYGTNGARMTGPAVVEGGGGFRAAIASTVTARP